MRFKTKLIIVLPILAFIFIGSLFSAILLYDIDQTKNGSIQRMDSNISEISTNARVGFGQDPTLEERNFLFIIMILLWIQLLLHLMMDLMIGKSLQI